MPLILILFHDDVLDDVGCRFFTPGLVYNLDPLFFPEIQTFLNFPCIPLFIVIIDSYTNFTDTFMKYESHIYGGGISVDMAN